MPSDEVAKTESTINQYEQGIIGRATALQFLYPEFTPEQITEMTIVAEKQHEVVSDPINDNI